MQYEGGIKELVRLKENVSKQAIILKNITTILIISPFFSQKD